MNLFPRVKVAKGNGAQATKVFGILSRWMYPRKIYLNLQPIEIALGVGGLGGGWWVVS